MKKFVAILALTTSLVGCNTTPNWEHDCQRNYSVNSREFDTCMRKVEEHKDFDKEAGTVSLDPANADRISEESTQKSRSGL